MGHGFKAKQGTSDAEERMEADMEFYKYTSLADMRLLLESIAERDFRETFGEERATLRWDSREGREATQKGKLYSRVFLLSFSFLLLY